MVVGIAAVAFTGFLLMLVILKFGGNSKFGIKGKTPAFYLHWWFPSSGKGEYRINPQIIWDLSNLLFVIVQIKAFDY